MPERRRGLTAVTARFTWQEAARIDQVCEVSLTLRSLSLKERLRSLELFSANPPLEMITSNFRQPICGYPANEIG